MAELHEAARDGEREDEDRSLAVHAAHGSTLGARGFAPRSPVRRRSEAHWNAVLHELGVDALHPRGQAGRGRLRAVRGVVREGKAITRRFIPRNCAMRWRSPAVYADSGAVHIPSRTCGGTMRMTIMYRAATIMAACTLSACGGDSGGDSTGTGPSGATGQLTAKI